MYYNNLHLRQT